MQVDPVPMSSDAATVAGAIQWAYAQLRGYAPPRTESWLWPLALSAFETAHWRDPRTAANKAGFYNYNVGNITTSGNGVDWFYDPAVTNGLKFASYPDLASGALAMLKTIDRLGGLAAADAGDYSAFQAFLNRYLGSTYPDLTPTIQALGGTVPNKDYAISAVAKTILLSASVFVLACIAAEAITPGSSPLSPALKRA